MLNRGKWEESKRGCKRRLDHLWKTMEVLCAVIIKFKLKMHCLLTESEIALILQCNFEHLEIFPYFVRMIAQCFHTITH